MSLSKRKQQRDGTGQFILFPSAVHCPTTNSRLILPKGKDVDRLPQRERSPPQGKPDVSSLHGFLPFTTFCGQCSLAFNSFHRFVHFILFASSCARCHHSSINCAKFVRLFAAFDRITSNFLRQTEQVCSSAFDLLSIWPSFLSSLLIDFHRQTGPLHRFSLLVRSCSHSCLMRGFEWNAGTSLTICIFVSFGW